MTSHIKATKLPQPPQSLISYLWAHHLTPTRFLPKLARCLMSSSIICWNIRGLNSPHKQKLITSLASLHSSGIVIALETRILPAIMGIIDNLFKVCPTNGTPTFSLSLIYAENQAPLKNQLWSDLTTLSLTSTDAHLAMGDFNALLEPTDKLMGDDSHPLTVPNDLGGCLLNSNLKDHPFSGCFYTWNNRQKREFRIWYKLDRILTNPSWFNCYPTSAAHFDPASLSDHSPAILNFSNCLPTPSKPFLFHNHWAAHEQFLPMVKDVLDIHMEENHMYRMISKLKQLKPKLKRHQSTKLEQLSEAVKETKESLHKIQMDLQMCSNDPRLLDEEDVKLENLKSSMEALKTTANHLAKISWAHFSDKNSSYFFKRIQSRRSTFKILSITKSDGSITNDQDEITSASLGTILICWGATNIMDKVERLIRNFLWTGREHGHRNLISWNTICKPKSEGGLGFKDLQAWNKACRSIFEITTDTPSLWLLWIKHHYIKRTNFWDLQATDASSWSWRSIIRIKNELRILQQPAQLTLLMDNSHGKYSTINIYNTLKPSTQSNLDFKYVWNHLHMPRCSFIIWLVHHKRLPTLSKLQQWNIIDDNTCRLCTAAPEDEDHLWFNCPFSNSVTNSVLQWLGITSRHGTLQNWLTWFSNGGDNKSFSFNFRLNFLSTTIYYIWDARNRLIYQQVTTTHEECTSRILSAMKQNVATNWHKNRDLASWRSILT
ncbi:hypothetical protein V2J09_018864 [Rumex salicifolius]